MTDLNNLFAETNGDDNVDHLAELVGDGKKFKTVADLAKGKAESDRYIATLTAQLDEARGEVNKRIALEELKTAILERDNNGNPPPAGTPPAEKNTVSADDLDELINKRLNEDKANTAKAANEAKVTEKLTSTWGANANAELAKAAQSVGMSLSELRDLGQRNPQALFKLIGVDGTSVQPNGGTTPRSSFAPNSDISGEKNKAYYDKLKVSDPKAYWDKRTQIQMNKDAMRLKERFYS